MKNPIAVFFFIFITVIAISISLILLKLFRYIGRKSNLSKPEKIVAGNSVFFILGIIVLVLFQYDNYPGWIYRNPIIYFSWRFAIAFLIGLPIMIAIRKYPETIPKLSWKTIGYNILFGLLIVCFAALLLPIVFFCSAYQFMFGYLPAIQYNPIQILIPLIAAIGLHYYYLKPVLHKATLLRKILFSSALILWIIGIMLMLTTPIIYLKPTNYNWYTEYLRQKYGVRFTHRELVSYPKPIKIVQEQLAPAGLVIKYLTFGEKAVDYSALND